MIEILPYPVPVDNFILYDVALVLLLWSRFRRVIDNKSCPPKKPDAKKQQCVYLMNRNSGEKHGNSVLFHPTFDLKQLQKATKKNSGILRRKL